jgi:methyl-accepting chemotaxis protein
MRIRTRLFSLIAIVVVALGAAIVAYVLLGAESRSIEKEYQSVIDLRYAVYALSYRMNALPTNQVVGAFKDYKQARSDYEAAYDRVAALKVLPRASPATKKAVEIMLNFRELSKDDLDNLTTQYARLIDDVTKYFIQADPVVLNQFYTDPYVRTKYDLKDVYARMEAFITLIQGLNDSFDTMIQAIAEEDAAVKVEIAVIQTRDTLLSMVVAFALIASAVVLAMRLAGRIVAPLKAAGRLAAAIASGDLTEELRSTRSRGGDELDSLASALEDMRLGLAGTVGAVRDSVASLRTIGLELAASTEGAAGSATEISGTVAEVKGRVDSEGASVRQVSATVDGMLRSVEELDAQIEDQASSVAQSSASIEELVSNVAAVAKSVDRLGDYFDSLLAASDEGRVKIAAMDEMAKAVQGQSEKLDEANLVIKAIAEQTNLLAMNAAIEAAHAGEAGRGFAVVAEEIRKLAEMAAEQSGEIGGDVKSIAGAIDRMAVSTTDVGSAFGTILAQIEDLHRLEGEIRRALEEQSEGSRETLEALQRINEITERVRNGSREMNGGNAAIAREMESLIELGALMREGMEGIARRTNDIAGAARSISERSEDNKELVEAVATQVGRFKIAARGDSIPA